MRTLSISDLDSFLEHGFHLAERHRHFVSLTMIGVTEPVDLWRLLSGATRESDLYFRIDDTLGVLLMSETDCAGAQTAAARLRERCGADFDVRAAIGTYPADNYSAPEFVTMVRRRMQLAQSSERGCVVSSG